MPHCHTRVAVWHTFGVILLLSIRCTVTEDENLKIHLQPNTIQSILPISGILTILVAGISGTYESDIKNIPWDVKLSWVESAYSSSLFWWMIFTRHIGH